MCDPQISYRCYLRNTLNLKPVSKLANLAKLERFELEYERATYESPFLEPRVFAMDKVSGKAER